MASTQNKENLQMKIRQANEKFSKITQRTALLSKLAERQSLNQESRLKSVAATQKLDSTVSRVLITATQTWQNDYKDEFIYNSEFKNTSWLEKEWNLSTKTWDLSSKTELGYDNQKRVNSMLMYDRDSLTQKLIASSKFLVFYNSEGIQDSTLMYSSETAGASWILDMKQINHYNVSKQLIKTDIWAPDEESGVLTLSMNVVYTYTATGNIKTSSTNYVMDGSEMLWYKTEYNYDGAGKLISSEFSMLNFFTFTMEKSSRNTYQYNASGDVSVEINSTWNVTSWVEENKYEYSYNATNLSDVIFPTYTSLISMVDFFGLNSTNLGTSSKAIAVMNTSEMLNGSWKNTDKTTFYYSSATSTNIVEFGNTLFSVYPNPANEHVNFNWKGNYESLSLEIYQNTGSKVLEQITYSGKPVSISKLGNGVYFYKLLNGQQIMHTGKMIKR